MLHWLFIAVMALFARARDRRLNHVAYALAPSIVWLICELLQYFNWLAPTAATLITCLTIGGAWIAVELAKPDPARLAWSCPDCRTGNAFEALTCASCRRVRPELRA
jgi:hypothetical protein